MKRPAHLALACFALASFAFGQTSFQGAEPNGSKNTASPALHMADGDSIQLPWGSYGLNFFRVGTAPAPLGIYRHELHGGDVMLFGSDAVPYHVVPDSLALLQDPPTSSATNVPAWYGFGRAEEIYVDLAPYDLTRGIGSATLHTESVQPVDLGTIPSGFEVDLSAWNAFGLDTSLQVFDAAFRPLPSLASYDRGQYASPAHFNGVLADGDYYIAATRGALATALPTTDRAAPYETLWFRPVTDDLGAVVAPSRIPYSMNFSVRQLSGGFATIEVAVMVAEPGEVAWFKLRVGAGTGIAAEDLVFCTADEAGASCSCGVVVSGRSAGCPNSTGRGALALVYEQRGLPQPASWNTWLSLDDLPPHAMALPFAAFGANVHDPVGGGTLCLDPGALRLAVLTADGDGRVESEFPIWAAPAVIAGQTVYVQAAYRDPAASAVSCQLNVTSGTAYRF